MHDPLECPKCHGPMRIIALIDDPPVPPEAWPVNSVLPMTYHAVPDIA